jgi:hypothetical protein
MEGNGNVKKKAIENSDERSLGLWDRVRWIESMPSESFSVIHPHTQRQAKRNLSKNPTYSNIHTAQDTDLKRGGVPMVKLNPKVEYKREPGGDTEKKKTCLKRASERNSNHNGDYGFTAFNKRSVANFV